MESRPEEVACMQVICLQRGDLRREELVSLQLKKSQLGTAPPVPWTAYLRDEG